MQEQREVYRAVPGGGVQLAAGADRWVIADGYTHLAPTSDSEQLLRWQAQRSPVVDDPQRQALVVIDMQNDFCAPGGWVEQSGQDPERCRRAIPGVQRAVDVARSRGSWVIWVFWSNRPDLRNLGAPTLHSFKHDPSEVGIGEDLAHGPVLTEGSWGARMVDELLPYVHEDDVLIPKVRMNGFHGTHLDQVLRTQGISTLFFAGVNVDQCVTTTMEDAYFRDYGAVLLEDACATSSPDHCMETVVYNARACWGFTMTVEDFATPQPFR